MRSLWALKPAARRVPERCIILPAPVGCPFQARVFLLPTDTLLFKSRDRLTITMPQRRRSRNQERRRINRWWLPRHFGALESLNQEILWSLLISGHGHGHGYGQITRCHVFIKTHASSVYKRHGLLHSVPGWRDFFQMNFELTTQTSTNDLLIFNLWKGKRFQPIFSVLFILFHLESFNSLMILAISPRHTNPLVKPFFFYKSILAQEYWGWTSEILRIHSF